MDRELLEWSPLASAEAHSALAGVLRRTCALIVSFHLQVTASTYLTDLRSLMRTAGHPGAGSAAGSPIAVDLHSDDRLDRAANLAAYLSIIYVLIAAGMSGTLLSRTRDGWEPTTPGFIVVSATLLSLAVPAAGLIAQLRALPNSAPIAAAPAHGADDHSGVPAPSTEAPEPAVEETHDVGSSGFHRPGRGSCAG